MPLPRIDYDMEVEADCVVRVNHPPFNLWFVMAEGYGDFVAFQVDDYTELVCLEPDLENNPEVFCELAVTVPGRRVGTILKYEEFLARWELESGPWFFPKRIGKLRKDFPLDRNTPLDILADWLQDHEQDEAAGILRQHLKGKK